MSQQRRGLGKGLGALIPQGPAVPAPGESVRETVNPAVNPAVIPAAPAAEPPKVEEPKE